MKYIIDFEDEPCRDKPDLYRMKHTNSVYISRETLEKFPKYEEQSEKDSGRLKELENLKEGDVVIATNDVGGIRRMGLVIFVWAGEEDPFEIVSNYGVVMRRSAKMLYELNYHKADRQYTTEEFFSKFKATEEKISEETVEELSGLQAGDIIYKYVSEEKMLRRMVNFVYTVPAASYELIDECGCGFRYSLETIINDGWRKVKSDLTTKEFYWKQRGGAR